MTATPGTVILPTDTSNTGKLVDNTIVTNESSVSVYRQAISIADPAVGGNRQTVNSSGGASVTTIPVAQSQLIQKVINTAASGSLAIAAGVAGQTIRLYRLVLFVGGATNITFEDGTTPLSGPIPLNATGSIILDYSGDPWYTAAAGDALNINSSNAVQLSGTAYYAQS